MASPKFEALHATFEGLCEGPWEELPASPSSSLNEESEEFLTPDSEFLFGSTALHELSRLESSATGGGEDLRVTQILWREDPPAVARGKGKRPPDVPEGGAKGLTHHGEEGLCHPEGRGEDSLNSATGSPVDIRDLSSISYEGSCQPPAPHTPRNPLSPADASTPVSPASSPRFSLTLTKHKDYCVATVDAASLVRCEGPPPAREEDEKSPGDAALSPGRPQPGIFSKLYVRLKGRQEPGTPTPSTQQDSPEKGDPEEEPEEISLSKCRADFSLWTSGASSAGDKTERAHSSLDHDLDGVFAPAADSRDLREKAPDPVKRLSSYGDLRNVEMKRGAEESFSESDGSAAEAEEILP